MEQVSVVAQQWTGITQTHLSPSLYSHHLSLFIERFIVCLLWSIISRTHEGKSKTNAKNNVSGVIGHVGRLEKEKTKSLFIILLFYFIPCQDNTVYLIDWFSDWLIDWSPVELMVWQISVCTGPHSGEGWYCIRIRALKDSVVQNYSLKLKLLIWCRSRTSLHKRLGSSPRDWPFTAGVFKPATVLQLRRSFGGFVLLNCRL